MTWIRTAETLTDDERELVGGKAWRLARLERLGYRTAPWLCVTTRAYGKFLDATGLRERIALELHRKAFEEMRWEELWDCATRIRHLFHTTPMPADLGRELAQSIRSRFAGASVAVRSSAADEDSAQASFAGLHDSYLSISGTEEILRHVRLVWASLWSDAALLYRKEIGLAVSGSAMAVVVQEMVAGASSGVVFTVHPAEPNRGVIEAVHGLNQGLVDGEIEPDRWIVDRDTGSIVSHVQPLRTHWVRPTRNGVRREPLDETLAARPPLPDSRVFRVWERVRGLEAAFEAPQDVEFTWREDRLVLLQTRPVTTHAGQTDDRRGWYLSLHRSFEQLIELRRKIETEHIPAMIETAGRLAGIDPEALSTPDLIEEIRRRWEINRHWTAVYWSEFIPYAHGIRLFGQFYNDRVRPQDPYEFIDLLARTDMQSLERNGRLQDLADRLRREPNLVHELSGTLDRNPFERRLKDFLDSFGDLSTGVTGARTPSGDLAPLIGLIKELAARPPQEEQAAAKDPRALKERYLNRFSPEERPQAEAMLDLARSSYRLRDDDNIHLGRIEARFLAAVAAGRRRAAAAGGNGTDRRLKELLDQVAPEARPTAETGPVDDKPSRFRQRQLVGQPAGPGLVRGPARVITDASQLMSFRDGEILVCDSVDPNMTFVVPLAAGIVERRGGMLIHGAIIAREYGLPCITGAPRATDLIETGDRLTVDGYLGIVTVG